MPVTTTTEAIDIFKQFARQHTMKGKEEDLRTALEGYLIARGYKRGKDFHKPNTGSMVDMIFEGCSPPVIIEIKRGGDWKMVAEATFQLLLYQMDPHYRGATKVMLLGSEVQHGEGMRTILRERFADISLIEVGRG